MSAFKAPLDPSTALGGFSGNNYSEVHVEPYPACGLVFGMNSNPAMMLSGQASAFIITYPVNNALDKEGNDTSRAVAWEKAFIQLAQVILH